MPTLLKSLAFVVLIVCLQLQKSANATGDGESVDEVIFAALESSYSLHRINGKDFKREELDILSRRSPWNAAVGKQSKRKVRNAVSDLHLLWEDAHIPYNVQAGFNDYDLQVLHQAMAEYHNYTCIRFRKKTASDKDYVSIVDSSGCLSEIGRRGGEQQLSLPLKCRKKNVVLHELGHVIGLSHEHSRPDREDHVFINLTNVPPEFREDFDMSDWTESLDSGIPYDYFSIMHYGESMGSKGRRVITTKDRRYQSIIGQQKGLSFRDVKLVNLLYTCSRRNRCPEITCLGEAFVGQDCLCWCPALPNITSASVHCSSQGALLYVDDILKIISYTANNDDRLDLPSNEQTAEIGQSKINLLIQPDSLPNRTIQYNFGHDSDFVKLALLGKIMKLHIEHTCTRVFVEAHRGNVSIEVLDANGVSSLLKNDSRELLLTWTRECVTATSDGFIMRKMFTAVWEWPTIICMDAATIFGSEDFTWFRSSAYWWTHIIIWPRMTVFSLWLIIIVAVVLSVMHIYICTAICSIAPVLLSILYLDTRTALSKMAIYSTILRRFLLKVSGEAAKKPSWLLMNGTGDDEHLLSPLQDNGDQNVEIGFDESQEVDWTEAPEIDIEGSGYIASVNFKMGALRFVRQEGLAQAEIFQPQEGRVEHIRQPNEASAAEVVSPPGRPQSCVRRALASVITVVYIVIGLVHDIVDAYNTWVIFIPLLLLVPYSWISFIVFVSFGAPGTTDSHHFVINLFYHLFTRNKVRGLTFWLGPKWYSKLIYWWRRKAIPRRLLSGKRKAWITLSVMIILGIGTFIMCLYVDFYILLIFKLQQMRWPMNEQVYWSYSKLTELNISFAYDSLKKYNMMYRCSEQSGCSPLIRCPDGGFVGQDCRCWCPPVDENMPAIHC